MRVFVPIAAWVHNSSISISDGKLYPGAFFHLCPHILSHSDFEFASKATA